LIPGWGTWSPNAPLLLHMRRTQTNPEISDLMLYLYQYPMTSIRRSYLQ